MDEAQGEVVIDPTDGGEEIVTAGNRIGHKVPHLVVDGVDERDIFAYAPTMICDRVHWDTVDDFDARRLVNELRIGVHAPVERRPASRMVLKRPSAREAIRRGARPRRRAVNIRRARCRTATSPIPARCCRITIAAAVRGFTRLLGAQEDRRGPGTRRGRRREVDDVPVRI
jgi:hypothetical protein